MKEPKELPNSDCLFPLFLSFTSLSSLTVKVSVLWFIIIHFSHLSNHLAQGSQKTEEEEKGIFILLTAPPSPPPLENCYFKRKQKKPISNGGKEKSWNRKIVRQ